MDYNDVGSLAYWYLFSQQEIVDHYKGHMVAIVDGTHVYSVPINKNPEPALREVSSLVSANHQSRDNLSIFPAPRQRIDLEGVDGYLEALERHDIPGRIRLEGLLN